MKHYIPGYKTTVRDKQADLKECHLQVLLGAFDSHNSPQNLVNWFYRKINGLNDVNSLGLPKFCLQQEIAEYLRDHFHVEIGRVRDVIYDEDYFIKVEVVAACLELAGVITPRNATETAVAHLERLLKTDPHFVLEYNSERIR